MVQKNDVSYTLSPKYPIRGATTKESKGLVPAEIMMAVSENMLVLYSPISEASSNVRPNVLSCRVK